MQIIRQYWRIVFPIFFILLIWFFSSQNGADSDTLSIGLATKLGLTNGLIRKLAHVVLFSCLGYSVASFLKGLHPATFPDYTMVIFCVIFTAVYGAIDEVHQLTVSGRSANFTDILIDSVAGLWGVLLYTAIFCFFRRWKIRRAQRLAATRHSTDV
ncbi:VanZ family protein [Candidatus Saccharibacteria bacterium]|nr:VanZ family protein [Candidatus Saccharibacteria bacterium]